MENEQAEEKQVRGFETRIEGSGSFFVFCFLVFSFILFREGTYTLSLDFFERSLHCGKTPVIAFKRLCNPCGGSIVGSTNNIAEPFMAK